MDRMAASQALMETFSTMFEMLEHVRDMRYSMHRIEQYMLAVMLMCATLFVGELGGDVDVLPL